jgi:transposase-like protein
MKKKFAILNPEDYLQILADQLLIKCEHQKIRLTRGWASAFPSVPGVYVFKYKGKIIYVGETGNLRGRMKDMLNTKNHVLRRNIDPQIIKKRETILAESLESKIIGLYSHGMSFRDISAHIKEMYDTEISAATLSAITDKVIPLVKEWQNRPLESLYCIVWLDAMFYKVKEEGRVINRCVYNILGINAEGRKDLLGMYVSESEGANFWLGVLAHLQQRGVADILIACIDNLKGFAEAIATIYPATEVQTCIVHQIRNSIKYVASKDQKAFMADLKPVYQATSKDEAEIELVDLEEKWDKKYPVVIDSWKRNWDKLSTYFQYSAAIRKLIYTTNTIEGFHRQVRKITKTKGAFPSDVSLLKLIYLATQNIQKKWTQPLQNWGLTVSQLSIKFGDRLKLKI